MASEHAPGDLVAGRYRIESVLGRGGFGITYAAFDQSKEQKVALKEMTLAKVDGWKSVELFEREARVLENLEHVGIPKFVDRISDPLLGHMILVQELIEGKSLAELIRNGMRLDETEVLELARQILRILSYLHERNPPVIHRDVKPNNLIRRPNGVVVLVDFGSVRDTLATTTASSVVGTFGYMAPEQLKGHAIPATDLFGLGATLIHLLSGHSPSELPEKRLKIDFRSVVNISPHLAGWIEKLIEPIPEDRFASAAQALEALDNKRPVAQLAPVVASTVLPMPFGSRVKLRETPQSLQVRIPGAHRAASTGTFFFSMFWLTFVAFWTWGASQASLLFACFSIPFWLVGLGLLYSAVNDAFGTVDVKIDQQRFHIGRTLFGIKRSKTGQRQNLNAAVLAPANVRNRNEDNLKNEIVLREGIREHRFGGNLSAIEREWLVQAINTYLDKMGQ